jgi:transcriptional regulator with XRE-family HTH domain
VKLKPGSLDILIGANLRRLRIGVGVGQPELAAFLGVSFQQVQRYEQGQTKIPGSTLIEISDLLKAPIGELLGVEVGVPPGAEESPYGDVDLDRLFVAVKTLRNAAMRDAILGLIDDFVEVSLRGPRGDG